MMFTFSSKQVVSEKMPYMRLALIEHPAHQKRFLCPSRWKLRVNNAPDKQINIVFRCLVLWRKNSKFRAGDLGVHRMVSVALSKRVGEKEQSPEGGEGGSQVDNWGREFRARGQSVPRP